MQRSRVISAVAGSAALVAALAACSSTPGAPGGDADYVSGGTFIVAGASDVSALIPMTATAPDTLAMIALSYESLVYATPDGDIVPWLAEKWEEESGTEVSFTLRDGITCQDGTDFTAETAASNINYNADPANATILYGSIIVDGTVATADGNVVTVTVPQNDPFLLANVGLVQMVCQAGLDDPESLSEATNGTGLFELSEIKAQASYTFTKRDGYTWGPDGVTSDTVGLPDNIEVRIIPDESTSANLLLSGDINAAVVLGPDRARLDAAGLDSVGIRNPVGEILFNEKSDRPTADPLVREALTTAINRDEVGTVIADGAGLDVVSLVTKAPLLCVPKEPNWKLPDFDLDRAGQLLDEAGWTLGADGLREKDGKKLELDFIYDAGTATHAPAAELLQQQWDKLGITTVLHANDAAAWSDQLWVTFDWDLGWVQISGGGPVILSAFYAGPTPDNGGLNFMFVDNPEYSSLAKQAMAANPNDSCGLWQQAEKSLIENFDVVPVIDNILPTYMNGAVFEQPGYIQPTTIRMLG